VFLCPVAVIAAALLFLIHHFGLLFAAHPRMAAKYCDRIATVTMRSSVLGTVGPLSAHHFDFGCFASILD